MGKAKPWARRENSWAGENSWARRNSWARFGAPCARIFRHEFRLPRPAPLARCPPCPGPPPLPPPLPDPPCPKLACPRPPLPPALPPAPLVWTLPTNFRPSQGLRGQGLVLVGWVGDMLDKWAGCAVVEAGSSLGGSFWPTFGRNKSYCRVLVALSGQLLAVTNRTAEFWWLFLAHVWP